MAIFLHPMLDLGRYYRNSKTQWVKRMIRLLQIVAQTCIKNFQIKPHFKVVMYGCKVFGSYCPRNHEHMRDFQKSILGSYLKRFNYLHPNFQIE